MSEPFAKNGIHVGFNQDLYFGNNDNGFYVKKGETGIAKYDETNRCFSVELDAVQGARLHNIRYVVQVSENEIYSLEPVKLDDINILVIFNKDINGFVRRGTVGRTYKSDTNSIIIRIENNPTDTEKFVCYHTIDEHDLNIISKSPHQDKFKNGDNIVFCRDVYFEDCADKFHIKKGATGEVRLCEETDFFGVSLDIVPQSWLSNVVRVSPYDINPARPVDLSDNNLKVVFNSDYNTKEITIKRGSTGTIYSTDMDGSIVCLDDHNEFSYVLLTDLSILSILVYYDHNKVQSKPKKLSDFRSPTEIRIQWMKLIGMEEDEILENIINDPAISVEEEEQQFDAALKFYNIGR